MRLPPGGGRVKLSAADLEMLEGRRGEAARFAMSIIVQMAEVVGADELLTIAQAHLDACALMSQSSLEFIEYLTRHDGRVQVPTTLNMVSLDLDNWRKLRIPRSFGEMATRIAEGYLRLGCIPTWTCAPYQGYLTPRFGQQIAWGESNAIAYANSVLGARTNRYGDYMDVCAALTGRVPKAGLHVPENRRGQVLVRVHDVEPALWHDTAAWAAFGHVLGHLVGSRIPVIHGLPQNASGDQLKALAAAAASAGAVALFHAIGLTPEAPSLNVAFQGGLPQETVDVGSAELASAWADLSDAAGGDRLDALILGCPHFSYAELEALAEVISDLRPERVHPKVQMMVMTNAAAHALAARRGLVETVERFGATVILDTCPFHFPIVRKRTRVVMTNSGKCAYYAPGELGVRVAFGSLRDCIRSATSGTVVLEHFPWKDV